MYVHARHEIACTKLKGPTCPDTIATGTIGCAVMHLRRGWGGGATRSLPGHWRKHAVEVVAPVVAVHIPAALVEGGGAKGPHHRGGHVGSKQLRGEQQALGGAVGAQQVRPARCGGGNQQQQLLLPAIKK